MPPQKSRLLTLLDLLNRETVAKDIETLQAHGVDVICNSVPMKQI